MMLPVLKLLKSEVKELCVMRPRLEALRKKQTCYTLSHAAAMR